MKQRTLEEIYQTIKQQVEKYNSSSTMSGWDCDCEEEYLRGFYDSLKPFLEFFEIEYEERYHNLTIVEKEG